MGKIFGNKFVVDTIENMAHNNRISHAFLIYGESGLGKKAIASYIAEKITGAKNVHSHPDIIWVEHSGKSNGFSVASLRDVCADAYIIPNTSDKKVYILADCDNISTLAQDTLLKIVEEPPPYAHFIFTASTKNTFLPTIISRVVSLGASYCSIDECEDALKDKYSDEQIKSAYDVFSGNIGMMIKYICDDSLKQNVENIRKITDSIASGDEYSLLLCLNNLVSDRQTAKNTLLLLQKVIRDASAFKVSYNKGIGCYKAGSEKLAESFSIKKLENIYDVLGSVIKELDTNVGMGIELCSLCARIISV